MIIYYNKGAIEVIRLAYVWVDPQLKDVVQLVVDVEDRGWEKEGARQIEQLQNYIQTFQ